ncbi:MAG: hypothetical protein KDA45_02060 [Planctomycetales bacterium]|nr:hypothetical protein [Planctomycetales bacterium]
MSGADQRSVTDSRQDQAAPGSLPTPAIIASGDGHRASIPQRSEAWPQEGEVAALPANQRLAGFQSTGFLSTGFQSAGSQSAGSPSLESPPLELQAEAIDVLAEVEQWTRAAAQQQGEQLLTNDSGRLPGLAPSEPLRLATYPMWQLQRVALPTRLRRPWWSLRLQAGKGLVVQPEQAQPLSERGTARWLVYAEQAVAPVTRVVVQAEQARHRAGSLRWRVAATADDLPLVVVPLGLEHVRQLQDNLRGGAGRLQLEIDRLRRLSRADGGLPRGMRSAVRAQRRNLETQHQLSLRLLEIVADAGQITGWLDGQFQVHAELRDEALPSGEPLLQFGQVLLGPTAAVELPAAESSPAASLATESIAAESGPVTAGGSAEGVAVEAK